MSNNPENLIIRKQEKAGLKENYTFLAEQVADGAMLPNLLSVEIELAGGIGAFMANKAEQFTRDNWDKLDDMGVLKEDADNFLETLARTLERRKTNLN